MPQLLHSAQSLRAIHAYNAGTAAHRGPSVAHVRAHAPTGAPARAAAAKSTHRAASVAATRRSELVDEPSLRATKAGGGGGGDGGGERRNGHAHKSARRCHSDERWEATRECVWSGARHVQ